MAYLGADVSQTFTDLRAGNTPSPGAIVRVENATYKFVQYHAATAGLSGVEGQVAYYMHPAGQTDRTATHVTSDVSDSYGLGAGVLQADVQDGAYCWVQIKGEAALSIALTSGADGDQLTARGATDGTLAAPAALPDAVKYGYVGYVIDATIPRIICNFPE
jgi:hypothetical protein